MSVNLLNKKTFNEAVLLLPFVFSFAFMIWFEGASKVLVMTTVISLLGFAIRFRKNCKTFLIENLCKPFHILIWAFALFIFIQSFLHGVSSREIRALLCLSLIALYFPFCAIKPVYYRAIIALGCVTVFANSIYFNIVLGLSRESGVINPIPYAGITALLALLSIHFSLTSKNINTKILFGFFAILSVTSLILTESRGVWLAFACALLVLVFNKFKLTLKRIILFLILISSTVFMFSTNFVDQRIEQTRYEFEQIQQGNMNTSIGLRLQMWQAAIKLSEGNWLLGLGTEHFNKLELLYQQQKVSKALYDYHPPHYHNQFIDSVVKSGVIGLVFLLFLLFMPLYLVRHVNKNVKKIVGSVVMLYVIMGLTDAPFYNGQTFILYVLSMLFLLNNTAQPSTQAINVEPIGA
ncbi:O-antigen ligase family protein [Vibrio fluvialis]|uniref:O-antigen ligase family protein n=1 Tax=Vibrio fluvialis TaxID=676 RepID=UPI001EEC84AF|nr:O-antigen ligase family protein [Vibrio fluvialis]EKO3395496.1 O-antigen ligase family protein [Vibrio fluvialis]EKO3910289.1 O-antigen ligase family protein [Vibrio fluvialis]MCG6380477.1 O-antigen ligase family protein [Vibrio fluvialis]